MKPNRRSIRLSGYDYASAGWYFVTMCCKNRAHLFGEIRDGEMILNEAGVLVEKWWNKIPEKFPEIELGEYQIMPNHFHAIVINVGADPCVGPENQTIPEQVEENKHPDSNSMEMADPHAGAEKKSEPSNQGEHTGSPLHLVIQWFKTMTANEFIRNVKYHGWEPFENKIWQRNYYEHIIRNEESHSKIAAYIRSNPACWEEDEYFL